MRIDWVDFLIVVTAMTLISVMLINVNKSKPKNSKVVLKKVEAEELPLSKIVELIIKTEDGTEISIPFNVDKGE